MKKWAFPYNKHVARVIRLFLVEVKMLSDEKVLASYHDTMIQRTNFDMSVRGGLVKYATPQTMHLPNAPPEIARAADDAIGLYQP
jgi:hypothetical protein